MRLKLLSVLLIISACQGKRRGRTGKDIDASSSLKDQDLIPIPDDYVDEDYHDYGEALEGLLDGDYEDGRIFFVIFYTKYDKNNINTVISRCFNVD